MKNTEAFYKANTVERLCDLIDEYTEFRDSDTSDQDAENPLEVALMSFESGHSFDREDFNSKSDYEKYCAYMDYGPEGFYEEFHDKLNFSSEFIEEFGRL